MIGNIVGIEENTIFVKLNIKIEEVDSLINLYVVMENKDKRIVGEIANIKNLIAEISLVGEIIGNKFVPGIIQKPSFGSTVKLIARDKVDFIVGIEDYNEKRDLYLGLSPIYPTIKIGTDINKFFSSHFAIFGSTGSGKSCGFARIIQNLFEKEKTVAYRSNIFIFDAYGEYHDSFKDIGKKCPEVSFKSYTTNLKDDEAKLCIPLWLLGVDDIAILLGATSNTQIPIIEKAMKYVTIFGREEEIVLKHKNDIIARALLEILLSGRPSTQIRDQITSILSSYHTRELNLDSPVYQPGYTRPLKQCLLIDASGKMREIELLTTFLESFLSDGFKLEMPDGSFKYSLKDLCDAFEFALIDEGGLKSDKTYDEANPLKVRLHALLDGEYARYFECDKFMTRAEYIKSLITVEGGRKAQIINFNINHVDDRFAKTVTKIYSRLLFDYAKNLERRASMPFHIVLEEAHRYVQNDSDIDVIGYNIFDRITKEGRKYGVLLGLISQRPSELSETSLSQCNNFLIFKMMHPLDIQFIHDMIPNITEEILKRIKSLQPGNCMAFGTAFRLPTLIRMEMPDPRPSSSSCDVSNVWFIDRN